MKQVDVIRDYFLSANNSSLSFYDEAIDIQLDQYHYELIQLLTPLLKELPVKESIEIQDSITDILTHAMESSFRIGIDSLSVFLGMDMPYNTFKSDNTKPHYY